MPAPVRWSRNWSRNSLQDDLTLHVAEQSDGTLIGLTETGRFHVQRLHLNRSPMVLRRREQRENCSAVGRTRRARPLCRGRPRRLGRRGFHDSVGGGTHPVAGGGGQLCPGGGFRARQPSPRPGSAPLDGGVHRLNFPSKAPREGWLTQTAAQSSLGTDIDPRGCAGYNRRQRGSDHVG